MSKVFGRCEDKTVRTELVEGLGNTYGFAMARKESLDCYLCRMLYHMFYHEKPFQAQLGDSGCDGIPGGSRVKYLLIPSEDGAWSHMGELEGQSSPEAEVLPLVGL